MDFGTIVKIYGEVKKVGKTSVTLGIEARLHNPSSGQQKIIATNEIVFVKVDEYGDPEPI